MERKKPLKGDPDAARSWQQRSRENAAKKPGRAPGSTLAAKGARSKRLAPALAAAYREVDQRDGRACQFTLLDSSHRCPRGSLLHHDHLWPRNVRPDLREAGWAIVLLCAPSHDHVTNNPGIHRDLRIAVLAERIAEWIEFPCHA